MAGDDGPIGPFGPRRIGPVAGLVSGERNPFGDIMPGRIGGPGGPGGRGRPLTAYEGPGPANCEGEGERGEASEPGLLIPGILKSGEPDGGTLGKDATEVKDACRARLDPVEECGEAIADGSIGGGGKPDDSLSSVEEGVTEIAGDSAGVDRLPLPDPAPAEGPETGAGARLLPVLTLRPSVPANFWHSSK